MPHPDLFWYRLNGMGAKEVRPESSFEETLFLHIFHVKTRLNIVYEYLRTKIFSRDTSMLPQIIEYHIFGHSAITIEGF